MSKPLQSASRSLASVLACATLLTACGGGGSSGLVTTTITAKDGELIVIDAGSSGLAAKTYALVTNYDASYARYRDFSFGRLIKIAPEQDAFDTSMVYVQGTPAKFMVALSAQVGGAALGTYKDFACRSSAWTTAELNAINAQSANLPVCASTITIDETTRRAAYANISLPALESGGKTLLISAGFSWPAPVLDPSLGASGSGSGGGSITAPPVSTQGVITPLMALNEVMLTSNSQGNTPILKLVTEDPYASAGSFQLNGKALQVVQALTGAEARLSVVSDPSDRKRYLVLLRLNDATNPSSTRDHLCAGGTWTSSDLDGLFGISGMVAPPCEGDLQFVNNGIAPRLILNQVKVAVRMASAPAATVSAHLDASLGEWPFYGYADTYGLFLESGLPPFGMLDISDARGRISASFYTQRSAAQGTEPTLDTVTLADGQVLEVMPVDTDEASNVMTLVRLADTPEQFLLYMAPDTETTASCRAPTMSDEQATLILRELALMGGYATVAPAGAVDACVGASHTPSSGRLRLTDTVLTHKSRSVRNPITITVTTQATLQANLKLAH